MPYAQQIEVTNKTQFNIDNKSLPNFLLFALLCKWPTHLFKVVFWDFVNDVYV